MPLDPPTEALIRSYCGWHVAPVRTETLTVDGSGGTIQPLPTLHVVAVDAVENDGVAVADVEWSESGFLRGRWTSKLRGVTVTLTHGYVTWPAEIEACAARLAAAERIALTGGGQVSIGAVRVAGPQLQSGTPPLDPYVAAILDRYRLPPRA